MDKILVVGVDTVAGANLALYLAEKYQVTTWHPERKFDIANCDALDPADAPRTAILKSSPDWILYCGPTARSSWEPTTKSTISDSIVEHAAAWAAAATELEARFLMVSSDAVFSGPWMFHDEESIGECSSLEAITIRAAEEGVLEVAPNATIVRTNVFGWSADPENHGWIENLLEEVETKRIVEQDAIRHATPILATDFAAIIERACLEEVSGIFHIAGAERVNPLKFTQRLADQFDLRWLAVRKETVLMEPPKDFASGETSLQTKRIRKELCVAMPLLSEGLKGLFEQTENGYRDRLVGTRQQSQVTLRAA